MTKTQNRRQCEQNMICSLLKLLKKNIPGLLLWEHKGQLRHLGSTAMSKWFEELDEDIKKNIQEMMVEDTINISENKETLLNYPDTIPDTIRASSLYSNITSPPVHSSGVPLLPFPLEYLSKKELVKYLSTLIRSEAKIKEKKVVFGSSDFVPSFWMENVWSWGNLKQALSQTKDEMYSGPGTFYQFLSQTVKEFLESNDLDPSTHVDDLSGKAKKMEKKKRALGLHDASGVVRSGGIKYNEEDGVRNSFPEFASGGFQSGYEWQSHVPNSTQLWTYSNQQVATSNIKGVLTRPDHQVNSRWGGGLMSNGQGGGLMNSEHRGLFNNNGEGGELMYNGEGGGIMNNGLGVGLINSGKGGGLMNHGEGGLMNGELGGGLVKNGEGGGLMKNVAGGRRMNNGQRVGLMNNGPGVGLMNSGLGGQMNSGEGGGLVNSGLGGGHMNGVLGGGLMNSGEGGGIMNAGLEGGPMNGGLGGGLINGELGGGPVNSGLGGVLMNSGLGVGLMNSGQGGGLKNNGQGGGLTKTFPKASVITHKPHVVPNSFTKPRRDVGISPFKVPNTQKRKKVKIAMKNSDVSSKNQNNETKYMDLPYQVENAKYLEGCKQQWNSGGGSCLYKCAAQHVREFSAGNSEVSYLELRKFAHKKLLDLWDRFEPWIPFPMSVTIGAGNSARKVVLECSVSFKEFLESEESMESFNESEVDLWILSYLLNTTVCTTTYNLPLGQGAAGSRIEQNFFPGQGAGDDLAKYSCQPEPLHLLNEHTVHWTRIVSEDSCSRNNATSASDCALSAPGGRAEVMRSRAAGVKKTRPVASNCSVVDKTNLPRQRKTLSKTPVAVLNEKRRMGKKQSSLSQNNPKHKRKAKSNEKMIKPVLSPVVEETLQVKENIKDIGDRNVAQKSEMYHKFAFEQPSLSDILQVPSNFQLEDDAKFDKLCSKISKRREKFDEEMEAVDEVIKREKLRMKLRRKRFCENRLRRIQIESELTQKKIEQMFEEHKEYFERVHSGAESSHRLEEYMKGGRSRDALRHKMITTPFNEEQVDWTLGLLIKMLGLTKQEELKQSNYLWMVLLPEVLIRFYQDFFKLDKQEAEMKIFETPVPSSETSDCESDDYQSDS